MYVLAQTIMMNTFGAVGFIANSIVIGVLVKFTKFSEKPSMQFILMQSLIDALASLSIIFNNRNFGFNFNIVQFDYDDNVFGRAVCYLWGGNMVMASLFLVSTYNLVFLTMERYFKILHPFQYMKSFRKWKLRLALFLPWLIGFVHKLIMHLPYYFIIDASCVFIDTITSYVHGVARGVWDLLATFVIPIIVMAFCYGKIFLTLKKSSKQFKGSFKTGEVESKKLSDQPSTVSKDFTNITDVEESSQVHSDCIHRSSTVVPSVSGGLRDHTILNHSVKKEVASPVNLELPETYENQGYTRSDTENRQVSNKVERIPQNAESLSKMKSHEVKISKSEKKVLKTLVIVTVCFFVCWFGRTTLFFLEDLTGAHILFDVFDDFVIALALLNSVINPFIYVITMKEYRHKLVNKFRK